MTRALLLLPLLLAGCSEPPPGHGHAAACDMYRTVIANEKKRAIDGRPIFESDLDAVADAARRLDDMGCAP